MMEYQLMNGNPFYNQQRVVSGRKDIQQQDTWMCYEALRLASFSGHTIEHGYPTQLARAGFFYESASQSILCFSCTRTLDEDELTRPADVHALKYPHCFFVRGLDTRNVPLSDSRSLFMSGIPRGNTPRGGSPRESPHNSMNNEYPAQAQRNMGTIAPPYRPPQQTFQSANQMSLGNPPPDSWDSDPNANPFGAPRSMADQQVADNAMRMSYEINRRASFPPTWPIKCPVSPADAAKAGFYFTGPEDRVKCTFCSGVLCNWAPGDTAFGEHARYFPKCPFILNANGVGNVPYEVTLQETQNYGGASVLAAGLRGMSIQNNTTGDIGVLALSAAHPNMASQTARMQSYENWNATSFPYQTPEELAEAGFIYTGLRDNVKCFFCDGGLRNWEEGDDPWVEHARWFPRCQFVLQLKGPSFIEAIQEQYPGQQNMPELEPMDTAGTHAGSANVYLPGANSTELRLIAARIDTPTVRTILEMGFTKRLVAQVILNRIRDSGDDFPNPQSLLEAVLELEMEHPELQEDMVEEYQMAAPEPSPEPAPRPVEAQLPITHPAPTNAGADVSEQSKKSKKKKKQDVAMETEGEDMKSIIEEHKKLKEERTCKICMDEPSNVVFLPCGHLCACTTCAPALRTCPMCRANIRGTLKTFIS
jgi:hypothetical protein